MVREGLLQEADPHSFLDMEYDSQFCEVNNYQALTRSSGNTHHKYTKISHRRISVLDFFVAAVGINRIPFSGGSEVYSQRFPPNS